MYNIYSDISGVTTCSGNNYKEPYQWYGFAWIIVDETKEYKRIVAQDSGKLCARFPHVAELAASIKALQSLPNNGFARVHSDVDVVHKILKKIKDRDEKYQNVREDRFNLKRINNLILREKKRLNNFSFIYQKNCFRSEFYHSCHYASRIARSDKFVIPSLMMSITKSKSIPNSSLQPKLELKQYKNHPFDRNLK